MNLALVLVEVWFRTKRLGELPLMFYCVLSAHGDGALA